MPCCKAEEFGHWCDDVEIVYTDDDGNEYCLFHAPPKRKGMDVKEFNNRVFRRIQDVIDHPEQYPEHREPFITDLTYKLNLSGTIFPSDIEFDYKATTPLPSVSFALAVFFGTADFGDTAFRSNAIFRGTYFSEDAYFDNAIFKKYAWFYSATFKKGVYFENTDCCGYANFTDAQFNGELTLDNSTFSKGTSLNEITCKDHVFLDNTKFYEETYIRPDNINKDIRFEKTTFNGKTILYLPPGPNYCFNEIYLGQVRLAGSYYTNHQFIHCRWGHSWGWRWLQRWAKEKGWEGRKTWGRRILADEKDEHRSHAYLEEEYRRLKQKYKAEGNEIEASAWHYSEKEMFRRKYWWRRYNPVSLTNLYKIFSGFGECPGRAAFWLILFIALPFLLIGWDILSPQGLSWPPDANATEAITEPAVKYLLFAKPDYPANHTFVTTWLTIITRLLVPIQAGLFGLALRNKFRR